MLGNYLQQMTSADVIFQMHFFLGALRVKIDFFSKISFRNTIRVSNRLDPDQDRYSVSLYLGPKCLPRLSADKTSRN